MKLSFYFVLSMNLILSISLPERVSAGKLGIELFSYLTQELRRPLVKFSFPKRQFCSDDAEKKYSWNKGFTPKAKQGDEKIFLEEGTTEKKFFFDSRRSLYFYKAGFQRTPMTLMKRDKIITIFSKEKG